MMSSKLLLLLLLPCLIYANPGVVDSLTNIGSSISSSITGLFSGKCSQAKFTDAKACAILFDDKDCDSWAEYIYPGYRELGWSRRNDAESVIVRNGCTFTGYQHSDADEANRGSRVVIEAKGKNDNVMENLKGRERLESMISSTDCTC